LKRQILLLFSVSIFFDLAITYTVFDNISFYEIFLYIGILLSVFFLFSLRKSKRLYNIYIFNILIGILYFIIYFITSTNRTIIYLFDTIKAISISATITTIKILIVHFFLRKNSISYLSIVHKFSLTSFFIIYVFIFYISNAVLKDYYNFSISQISKISTSEAKKVSSQIRLFLLSTTKQLEDLSVIIPEKTDLSVIYELIKDNNFIKKLEIYKDNKKITITKDKTFFDIVNEEYKKQKWYRYSFTNEKNSIFGKVNIPEVVIENKEIIGYATLPIYQNNNYWGIIKAEIVLNMIYNIIETEYNSKIYILDINSLYIFSDNIDEIGKSFTIMLEQTEDNKSFKLINNIIFGIPDSGMFITKNKKHLWIATDSIKDLGWKVLIFKNIDDVLSILNQNTIYSIGLAIIILLFSILFTSLISSRFMIEFKNLKIEFMKLANGYISNKLMVGKDNKIKDELYEIHNSINILVETLKELVKKNKSKSVEIREVIEKMILDSKKLKNIQDEQVYNIKKENESLKILDSQIKESSKKIDETQKEINNFSLEFKETNEQIANTSNRVKKILNTTKKIENITKIMSDIIEETSILALNASVEAAKAGKNAKGFGGIAIEIKRLYNQINTETLQIKEMINSIIEEINNAEKEIETIKKAAYNSATSLTSLTTKIEKIIEITKTELREIPNINNFTNNLSKSAENINSLINTNKETIEKIDSVFKELDKIINFFRLEKQD